MRLQNLSDEIQFSREMSKLKWSVAGSQTGRSMMSARRRTLSAEPRSEELPTWTLPIQGNFLPKQTKLLLFDHV
jgi:hypothetical protein